MFPVENQDILAKQGNGLNGGLNGRFGNWLKRKFNAVVKVAINLPVIGGAIRSVEAGIEAITGEDVFSDDGTIKTKPVLPGAAFKNASQSSSTSNAGLYEPTLAEQKILDAWVDNKLTPYYGTLANQLSQAYQMADFSAQLAAMNAVMLKARVIKTYFRTNETTGLSASAIALRSELIAQVLLPLENMIAASINDYEFVIRSESYTFTATPSNNAQFRPIIAAASGNFTVQRYVATDEPRIKMDTPKGNPTVTPTPLSDNFNPPKSTTGGSIPPKAGTTNPAGDISGAVADATGVDPQSKTGRNLLLLLLAAVGVGYIIRK